MRWAGREVEGKYEWKLGIGLSSAVQRFFLARRMTMIEHNGYKVLDGLPHPLTDTPPIHELDGSREGFLGMRVKKLQDFVDSPTIEQTKIEWGK